MNIMQTSEEFNYSYNGPSLNYHPYGPKGNVRYNRMNSKAMPHDAFYNEQDTRFRYEQNENERAAYAAIQDSKKIIPRGKYRRNECVYSSRVLGEDFRAKKRW